jgi:bifunctional UDP-N-acetylglucosamine pyrophosphorylase/glucosamine-1-phosphate N-acetyltransferase
VVQHERGGTGHATRIALEAIGDVSKDTVLVIAGDTPLFTATTVAGLMAAHHGTATVLTTRVPDPTGYGRVVRSAAGAVTGIVEEKDADEATRAITEVAMSTYVFDGAALAGALPKLGRNNAKKEQYLTDVIGLLAPVGGSSVADHRETLGINSHDQLAAAEALMRDRINQAWMTAGVWMQDPATTYVDATVELFPGVRLLPGVHLEGRTSVAGGAVVGPQTFVIDSTIGAGARVGYSVVRGAEVGERVEVGPYASIRPGTILRAGSKAGTFVEIKASEVGEGSKVPHLAYIGDATIGRDSNIGAGTITCNYDGFRKHRTVIGDRVFIGSDTMLVAPVEIGDDAVTGAGSVITRDVSPGALAVERSQQKELPGYAARRGQSDEAEGE